MSNDQALAAAKIAMDVRPKWTGSWYAIGRCDQGAGARLPHEKQFESEAANEVEMDEIPNCNYPHGPDQTEPAEYDGKTTDGPWAYMCEVHFVLHGTGLGLGRGRKLVLRQSIEE